MIWNKLPSSFLSIGPILSPTSPIDGGLVTRSQFKWPERWSGMVSDGRETVSSTSKFEQSIDLCWASSSKGTTMIALLEHIRVYLITMELSRYLTMLVDSCCGNYPSSSMRRMSRMIKRVMTPLLTCSQGQESQCSTCSAHLQDKYVLMTNNW